MIRQSLTMGMLTWNHVRNTWNPHHHMMRDTLGVSRIGWSWYRH